jgi:hypothetical protein
MGQHRRRRKHRTGRKVLIVDRDAVVRAGLRQLLANETELSILEVTSDLRIYTPSALSASRAATLWTPEESEIESCEHQDNTDIHRQPFPESVSEEREVYTDYDGCHRQRVKYSSYLSVHFHRD